MTRAPLVALFALAFAAPAAADEIETDPQCRLAAKLVNTAIANGSQNGLNDVGRACFCKYNSSHGSCKRGNAAPAQAKETDPVKLCAQTKSEYERATDDIKDLVSNAANRYTIPPRGWAGNEYQRWVDDKRGIGMLRKSELQEQLDKLQGYQTLNQDFVKNCTAALAAANGGFTPKMFVLKPLGGTAFEDNWPGKKNELAADLRGIQKAIENLSPLLN